MGDLTPEEFSKLLDGAVYIVELREEVKAVRAEMDKVRQRNYEVSRENRELQQIIAGIQYSTGKKWRELVPPNFQFWGV